MISGIIGLFFMLFCGTIVLLVFAFWIWMIIDAIQNKGLTDGEILFHRTAKREYAYGGLIHAPL
jgi:hypothetical protein